MSFLSELMKQRNKLKVTETVVTSMDGKRFVEKDGQREILPSCHGYVVDTKPDDIPVLISEHLYIGSQDCTAGSVLEANNIKHVLSIGVNIDDKTLNHKYIQCLDLPETDIKPVLKDCLPFIKEAVDSKENVLVHCNAGVSRTSMVAIAYLMHYEQMGFEEAYNFVKEKRPAIQPNAGFKKQLKTMRTGAIM